MNFNDIQEAWKSGGEDEKNLVLSSTALKKASQPIDRVRKNMKGEFFYQIAGILILGALPFWYNFSVNAFFAYYSIYGLMVIISFYYFYRFYCFFQSMENYAVNTKERLYEIYYELRLHIEMYKSFSFLLIPFLFFVLGIIGFEIRMNKNPIDSGEIFIDNDWILALVIMVFVTVFFIAIVQWWANYFYGKYAKMIRGILDEIIE